MTPALSTLTFAVALGLYAAATAVFYLAIVRRESSTAARRSTGPRLLGGAAVGHGAHVTIASFIAHVCPIHSVHFILSVAALAAIGAYLAARRRFRIDAIGLLV